MDKELRDEVAAVLRDWRDYDEDGLSAEWPTDRILAIPRIAKALATLEEVESKEW